MHELDTHQQPEASNEFKASHDPFVRKPYKKGENLKPLTLVASQSEDLSLKLSNFSAKSTPALKPRASLDSKLSNLIDFGIVPDVPLTCRDLLKLKHGQKQRIHISDFISKVNQKQIISFHALPDSNEFSIEKTEAAQAKKKVFPAFSFTGLSSLDTDSVRNSRTYQTLPPIMPKDLENFSKFRTFDSREENLKKIDKIVGDCEIALKEGKKNLKKLNHQVPCIKYLGRREVRG